MEKQKQSNPTVSSASAGPSGVAGPSQQTDESSSNLRPSFVHRVADTTNVLGPSGRTEDLIEV